MRALLPPFCLGRHVQWLCRCCCNITCTECARRRAGWYLRHSPSLGKEAGPPEGNQSEGTPAGLARGPRQSLATCHHSLVPCTLGRKHVTNNKVQRSWHGLNQKSVPSSRVTAGPAGSWGGGGLAERLLPHLDVETLSRLGRCKTASKWGQIRRLANHPRELALLPKSGSRRSALALSSCRAPSAFLGTHAHPNQTGPQVAIARETAGRPPSPPTDPPPALQSLMQ